MFSIKVQHTAFDGSGGNIYEVNREAKQELLANGML